MSRLKRSYKYMHARLDGDIVEFKIKCDHMIYKYGQDYDKFVDILKETMPIFCRYDCFLNNTYADALLLYICTRKMLDTVDSARLFEFSPFLGWSTYIMLRAIYDSGKDSKLISYELDKYRVASTSKHLDLVKDHIAFDSLELIHGNALDGICSLDDGSVDLMFVDSDHGYNFTKQYIAAGLFNKCKKSGFIHIHDFIFWMGKSSKSWRKKWQEPIAVTEHIMGNEHLFDGHCMGQISWLLGVKNTRDDLLRLRGLNDDTLKGDKSNYFVERQYPLTYWLGGTISGINKDGVRKNKTRASGLALWMLPNSAFNE